MMKESDKLIKVIVVTGADQEATAQRIEEAHEVTVLTLHDVGEELEESADNPAAQRDGTATSDAELGTENFVLQVIEQLPDETVAVLYDLEPADIDLLKAHFGDNFLHVSGNSAEQQVAAFLSA